MNKIITVVGLSFGLFIVATGCSQETTTKETHQEVKESGKGNSKVVKEEKEGQKKDDENVNSLRNKFLNQHQGYWKSEDDSTFIEVQNTSDKPLYIVHHLDGTKKEFSLQLDHSGELNNEFKGTITSMENQKNNITIKYSSDRLVVTTEKPVTFTKSNEEDYTKAVQQTKEEENKKQALDKTLQLLNGNWKATDNSQILKISVDNEQTGTFQWEGQDPVDFVINDNTGGKVSIVYESVASPSHNMIEWRWTPADKELVWDNLLGDTRTYQRIE
ncbi:hypothetical protein [Priestia megaterium]|uniref:hypothetical protein n=1 Tax=Priestia megaterium TaxID=1404 RepID=UPI00300AB56A